MSMRINTLSSQASISALDEPPTNVVEEDEVTGGFFSRRLTTFHRQWFWIKVFICSSQSKKLFPFKMDCLGSWGMADETMVASAEHVAQCQGIFGNPQNSS